MHGTVHVHDIPGLSAGSASRRVRVWTPEGYGSATTESFPVLYLQDGQGLFRRSRSRRPAMTWHADTTAQSLINADAIPPLILVGIDNAGPKRTEEYTPVAWNGEGGHAVDYADVLVNEILPFVDRTYRTRPGPRSTALGGSSLGGLFALYAGLRMPDVFGGILAMSPSVYWGDDYIVTSIKQYPPRSVRIWLDVGRHETATMRKGLRKLHKALMRNGGSVGGSKIRVTEDQQGRHDDVSWGRRFGRALSFLFPGERPARTGPTTWRVPVGSSLALRVPAEAGTRDRSQPRRAGRATGHFPGRPTTTPRLGLAGSGSPQPAPPPASARGPR